MGIFGWPSHIAGDYSHPYNLAVQSKVGPLGCSSTWEVSESPGNSADMLQASVARFFFQTPDRMEKPFPALLESKT